MSKSAKLCEHCSQPVNREHHPECMYYVPPHPPSDPERNVNWEEAYRSVALAAHQLRAQVAVLRGKLTQAEAERQVLDGIGEALESRGYVHMTNGRDIGLLLDELAQARILVEGAREAIAVAGKMLSEHIERFHDYDYEPHQVPPELADLRGIEHHLMGSLILDEEIAALPSTER